MYALIDCNNFYVSCELLFRPDLLNKPVIVLSNNDGCVVSRSNEAKTLGIKMGEPFFQVKALCREHKITVFSSNYALYADISHRVMQTIKNHWLNYEIYSIDEAFLDLTELPVNEQGPFCIELQKIILKHIGIPVSIGIGKTKTLAKAANFIAKKKLKVSVFNLNGNEIWLKLILAGDIWGIGRAWAKKLLTYGIYSAFDLIQANKSLLKKHFNIVIVRIALELQGDVCHSLIKEDPKKSITSSRSFGTMISSLEELSQALAQHCALAYDKLRLYNLTTQYITVFVQSNRFRDDLAQHHGKIEYRLIHTTDDLFYLTQLAKHCLKMIYRPNIVYKKIGIILSDLHPKSYLQYDLFNQINHGFTQRQTILKTIDLINHKYGKGTIRLAAEGFYKPWAMKRDLISPRYTTNMAELLEVT